MREPEDKLFFHPGEERKSLYGVRSRQRGERRGLTVTVRGNRIHVPDMKPLPGERHRLGAGLVLLCCGLFWGGVLCLLWLA